MFLSRKKVSAHPKGVLLQTAKDLEDVCREEITVERSKDNY